jgi:hypothetical protein
VDTNEIARAKSVRLAEPGDVLMVGEGIETCVAAMQAAVKPASEGSESAAAASARSSEMRLSTDPRPQPS